MLKASGISEDMLANGKYDSNSAQLYSRYKTMKSEWKSYVQLGRSGIAGFGLYAKKDICMHQMVCEYVGEIIRGEVKLYLSILKIYNGFYRSVKYVKRNILKKIWVFICSELIMNLLLMPQNAEIWQDT